MIRRIKIEDFPDCFEIARASYSLPFDEHVMYDWGVKMLHSPTTIAIRDDDAFGIATVSGIFWNPTEVHGVQQFLAVRNKAVWQAVKIVKTMRDWSTEVMGALDFQFGEATGMRMDILAKRVGAKPNRPTFVYTRGA